MTRELEILPGTTRSLTPASISANLPESTLIVRNEFSETLLDKDSPLTAEIHLLNYEKELFYLRKAEQDFEISTAEEYLEGERSENINIKKVAHLWEMAGVSYYIYPQNKFNDESETFITLAIAVCVALEGTFFVQDYSWNKPNLRTPSDLLTQFIERNH